MKNFTLKILQISHFCGTILVSFLASLAFLGFAFPLLDALNHFQPIWFVSTLLAILLTRALYRTARLRAFITAIGATGFLASAMIVVPEAISGFLPRAPLHSEGTNSIPKTYKLLTYNVFALNRELDTAADMISQQAPDFVVLQEYFKYQRRVLHPLLVERFPYSTNCVGKKRGNIALYARMPFSVDGDDPCQWDEDGRFASIVAQFSPIDAPKFAVVTTHLDWPVQISPLWRSARFRDGVHAMTARQAGQFETLAQQLADIEAPLILAGDLNSTSWSYGLRKFTTRNRLTRHTRNLATYPKSFYIFGWRETPAVLSLDHVMSSDGITVHDVSTADAAGSDHLPVITQFSVVN